MKHLLGETSPEEDQAVQRWQEEDASHRDYYRQLQQIWDSSKAIAASSSIDENKAWANFQQRIAKGNTGSPVIKQNNFSWMKVAAAVILLIGISVAAYFILNKETPVKELIAQTQQNVLIDTLSDGSVVTLNKKSSITYPNKFKGSTRPIALKGEAFFNVAPDKKKPFIITINDVQVTVVGTSFNVKNENGKTEVIVETGIVRVTKNGRTTELIAGEKLVINDRDSGVVKEELTDKLYNYYRSKEFVCDDTPLWKLVEVLNEAYNSKIVIGRKELSNLRINTTFNNESLDKVLEVIHLTFDITVVKKDGQIILQ